MNEPCICKTYSKFMNFIFLYFYKLFMIMGFCFIISFLFFIVFYGLITGPQIIDKCVKHFYKMLNMLKIYIYNIMFSICKKINRFFIELEYSSNIVINEDKLDTQNELDILEIHCPFNIIKKEISKEINSDSENINSDSEYVNCGSEHVNTDSENDDSENDDYDSDIEDITELYKSKINKEIIDLTN